MTEVEEFNPFEDLEDTTTANDSKVVAGVVEDNKNGAVEIVRVMKQLEKDNRLNETLETLETVNETPKQDINNNEKQVELPPKKKITRHRIPKPKGEKGRMLKELKKIWANEDNKEKVKGSDIVASASLYAELMGWRLKTPLESIKGDIMSITFAKDDKHITKPPANKMIASAPATKSLDHANTPATVTVDSVTTANDSNVSSKVVG